MIKYRLLLLLALSTGLLSAILVNHIPPNGYNTHIQTELRVEVIQGWEEVAETTLFFRAQDSKVYEQTSMDKESMGNTWLKGFLPVTVSPEKGYEYYFQFTLTTGAIETLPRNEPQVYPFLVMPMSKTGDRNDDFVLISDETSVSSKDGYVLAVSWYALDGIIDTKSIMVYINGKEVSKQAEIGNTLLVYRNLNPKPGVVTAYLTANTLDGNNIYSNTWTTVVKPSGNQTNLPMNLRGNINAGTTVLTSDQEDTNPAGSELEDDGWASMDVYGEYSNLRLQAYTYLSTFQKEDAQHVNRFRFGVMLPYWETYLGDYSPSFTNLTMSNKNLRGLYTKLQTKYFGISMAHGEMVRKIDGIVSTTKGVLEVPGTFKQEALATRIQLGREDGLYFGLTTTRNRDIISSLDSKFISRITPADTTQLAYPRDNIVLSLDARLNVPAQNIVIGVEGAGSLYNSNILPGPLTSDDLDEYTDTSLGVNPADFQDLFIINTNMQPLPLSDTMPDPRTFVAWQAYLRNFWLNNLINMSYSEVGASFKALSTAYQQNDVSQWSISDQYTYKQYLFLAAGLNQTTDNLAKHNLETNINRTFFLQGMLRIQKFPYLTGTFSQTKGMNKKNDEIEADPSLYSKYTRDSDMLAFGIGYDFQMMPVAPTSLDLGWKNNKDIYKRENAAKALATQYENDTQNISLSLISRFIDFPLKTQISIISSNQEMKITSQNNSNINFLLKGEYRLMQNKLIPSAEYRTTMLGGDQEEKSYNYYTLGLEARPFINTSIFTDLGWMFYKNIDNSTEDSITTTWHLTFSQRF